MKKPVVMFVLSAALAAAVAAQGAGGTPAPQPQGAPVLDAERRAAVIDRLGEALREVYVFPDVAEKMDAHLRQRLGEQAYDKLDALPAFTQQLTEDLQSISHDLHLRVMPMPPEALNAEQQVDEEAMERRFLESMRANNCPPGGHAPLPRARRPGVGAVRPRRQPDHRHQLGGHRRRARRGGARGRGAHGGAPRGSSPRNE